MRRGGADGGGLHAAALFTADGTIDGSVAADVGRRSVVDKLVGQALRLGTWTFPERLLFCTGRASPEVIQRAVIAGVPIVASIASASTLAVDFAQRHGVTLVGSVRGDSFVIYSRPDRISP